MSFLSPMPVCKATSSKMSFLAKVSLSGANKDQPEASTWVKSSIRPTVLTARASRPMRRTGSACSAASSTSRSACWHPCWFFPMGARLFEDWVCFQQCTRLNVPRLLPTPSDSRDDPRRAWEEIFLSDQGSPVLEALRHPAVRHQHNRGDSQP